MLRHFTAFYRYRHRGRRGVFPKTEGKRAQAASSHGLCGRGDDGGFRVVAADSGGGTERCLGAVGLFPAAIGFAAGVIFLLLADAVSPRLLQARSRTGRSEHWRRTLLMILAVTIHNLPEGMAVGAAFAGVQSGYGDMAAGAMALSLGVAIQNFPEGAIISMPLHAAGMKKGKAFGCGVLSGAVEPIGAGLTILLSFLLVPVLPYLLAFAAGAMLVVVAQELLPQACGQETPQRGAVGFTLGFLVMMVLDVALG